MPLNIIYRLSALAVSAGVHVLLVAWMSMHPGVDASGGHAVAALKVSLIPDRKIHDQTSITTTEVPEKFVNTPSIGTKNPTPESDGAMSHAPHYYSARDVTKMPDAISRFELELPPGEDNGIGGKVSVRLWINESGTLDHISLLSSELPETFEAAALSALGKMRFSPAEIGETAVRVWVDIVVEYADLQRRTQQVPDTANN